MPLSSSELPSVRSIVVGMSGGVDSAVAALLAVRQGLEVVGVTLATPCGDAGSAQAVCRRLGIPHRHMDVSGAFAENVVEPFIEAYAVGRTPNPCVVCNPDVKFAPLVALAAELGFDAVATGHYARVQEHGGEYHLLRGLDRGKDQSYMLYRLGQAALARLLLPLGALTKDEVRELALEAGLHVAERAESQDVCFIPDGEVGSVVARARREAGQPGPIVDTAGTVLGSHRGIAYYTVGQRRGLGIGGPGGPLYVLRIMSEENALVVGPEEALWVEGCTLDEVRLIGAAPGASFEARVMTRYRGTETMATVELCDGGRATVRFHQPHRAPTPGQSAAFYDGERLLGGGVIASASD